MPRFAMRVSFSGNDERRCVSNNPPPFCRGIGNRMTLGTTITATSSSSTTRLMVVRGGRSGWHDLGERKAATIGLMTSTAYHHPTTHRQA
eukprot:scaffold51049_cov35-Attheya_sp.AAC.1